MRFLKFLSALPLILSANIFAASDKVDIIESVKQSIECDALRCQPCQDDRCNPCCRLLPAYNAPASPALECAWDWYVEGSFIYWEAMLENMALGDKAFYPTSFATSTSAINYETQNFKFKYKPGFKVALGAKLGHDNWDLFAEYTWYHTSHMTSKTSAPGHAIFVTGTPVGFTDAVLVSNLTGTEEFATVTDLFNSISRSWKIKLDFVDLMLARSYYVGKKFTMRPAIGARAAYIRQNIVLTQLSTDVSSTILISGFGSFQIGNNLITTNKWVSWGYGLRGYIEADYLLGAGFRMLGNAAFDLLYTRYNISNSQYSPNLPISALTASKQHERHVDFVRPHGELEFGFGWNDCFGNGRWYIDFEAAYGFQVFWDQNMSLEQNDTALPDHNLFLHGARFSARFDF